MSTNTLALPPWESVILAGYPMTVRMPDIGAFAASEDEADADQEKSEGVVQAQRGDRLSSRSGADAYPAYEVIPSFDELYRKEWRYVAAVAERLMVRKADVRDVVQDVFIKAYRGLAKVENPGAVRGWLATITVRAVSDRLRRKKWQQALLFQAEQLDELPAHEVSPEVQVEVRKLRRALERLPVKERIAWGLRYIEQEPLDRVAELCECSLATAKRRIVAAQEKLDTYTGNRTSRLRAGPRVATENDALGGGREEDEP